MANGIINPSITPSTNPSAGSKSSGAGTPGKSAFQQALEKNAQQEQPTPFQIRVTAPPPAEIDDADDP